MVTRLLGRLLRERRGTVTMQWALGAAVLAGVAVASFPEVQGGVGQTARGIEDLLTLGKSDARSSHQAAVNEAHSAATEAAAKQKDAQDGGGMLGGLTGSDPGSSGSGSRSGSGGVGGAGGGAPATREDQRALERLTDPRSSQQAAIDQARAEAKQAAERQKDAQDGGLFGGFMGSDAGHSGSGGTRGEKTDEDVRDLERRAPGQAQSSSDLNRSEAEDADARQKKTLDDQKRMLDEMNGRGGQGKGSGSKSEPDEVEVPMHRASSRFLKDD